MAQDQYTASSSTSLLGTADQVGKFLGIAAVGLLVLSTAYDFSFLYAIGLSFEDVPSTLADHVRSAIVWAPRVTIYVLAFAMYEMFMRRMEKGLSEEELIQRSPHPKFTRAFRRGPQVLFAILAILMIITETLFTNSSHVLFMAGIGIWGVLSVEIVQHPRMGAGFSTTGGRLFVIVPIVVIWVGLIGYSRGESMLRNTVAQWAVELKVGQGIEKRQLLGLRRFSTSAVVVAVDRRVSVLPSENIVSAEVIRASDADLPRVCRWFGLQCQVKKAVP
jgi:hypothetical protein